MAEKKLNLLADFPEITTEKWMEKITVDLKGADFAKKLVWRTDEGFEVMPFYRQGDVESLKSLDSAPGKFPYVRGTKANNDWYVRQDIEVEDAKIPTRYKRYTEVELKRLIVSAPIEEFLETLKVLPEE